MIGLQYGENNCDGGLSRFHLIPERHGRTDRIAISISRISVLTRDKNRSTFAKVIAKIKVAPFLRHSIYSVPKKQAPCVKYSNTYNTEQKSLKITQNTLTSI